METKNKIFEENVGIVLSTLVASFIIGTTAMIYSNNKNSEVFNTRLQYMVETIQELKSQIMSLDSRIQEGSRDRWTRLDHAGYEQKVDTRFDRLEDRIIKLEEKQSHGKLQK